MTKQEEFGVVQRKVWRGSAIKTKLPRRISEGAFVFLAKPDKDANLRGFNSELLSQRQGGGWNARYFVIVSPVRSACSMA
jgi:hypothetical protein